MKSSIFTATSSTINSPPQSRVHHKKREMHLLLSKRSVGYNNVRFYDCILIASVFLGSYPSRFFAPQPFWFLLSSPFLVFYSTFSNLDSNRKKIKNNILRSLSYIKLLSDLQDSVILIL